MTAALPSWLEPWKEDESYRWAIATWERASAQPGAWFDHAKADAVVSLWPTVFRLTNDRFAGVPFKLLPWQDIVVRLLFGWKHPIEVIDPMSGQPATLHVRLFQTLRLWIPRKNGKSEFLAALALMFWIFDGVQGGEGYVFARDDKQADLPFGKMKAMVAQSPAMAGDVQAHATSMWLKPLASSFVRLTGAEDGKHGKAPTVTLGDEMHEWRSRKIEDDLRQGQGSRTEPIALFGSSAGLKSNPVGVELFEESQQLLDGSLDDPSVLVVIFSAPDDADWEDEAVWRRVNPSLGLSPTLQYLRGEARKAKGSPAKIARFRCYHLGQFIDDHAAWLDMSKWRACTGDVGWRDMAEANAGRRAFAAWDLSAVRDFTAKILLFPPDEATPKWRTTCRFWIPEARLAERKDENKKVPWDKWIDEGALELTPGDIVDQDFVKQALIDDLERYDLEAAGYDPWNSTKLVTDIEKECPPLHERLVTVRQGIQSLGNASKEFERLIYAGRFEHGGHPVLNWMARNTVIRFDENLNYMPAKKRSQDKIDGIVAEVIGLAVWLDGQGPVPVNPWDDPDFKLLED